MLCHSPPHALLDFISDALDERPDATCCTAHQSLVPPSCRHWPFAFCFPHCFGVGEYQRLSAMREREGQSMQTEAVRNITLTPKNMVLLSKITQAGQRRKWKQVQKLFSTYDDDDIPILAAVMHIACKCGSYEEGRSV